MRIFLTGMMGSGKTFWGKKIADSHQMPFVDLDQYMESQTDLTISEIFKHFGETYFRELEKEFLDAVIHQNEHCIIATGGGTPCFFDNLEKMKIAGRVFYFKTEVPILAQRIFSSKQKRPLLANLSEIEIAQQLNLIVDKRKAIYEQSDIIIEMNQIDETTFAQNFFNLYV